MDQSVIIKHIDPPEKNDKLHVNCPIDWIFGSCGFAAGQAAQGCFISVKLTQQP